MLTDLVGRSGTAAPEHRTVLVGHHRGSAALAGVDSGEESQGRGPINCRAKSLAAFSRAARST